MTEEAKAISESLNVAGKQLQQIIVNIANSDVVYTDIHIESDQIVRWKRPGGWEDALGGDVVSVDMIKGFAYKLNPDWEAIMDKEGSFDRSVQLDKCRLRLNIFYVRERAGMSISIRRHPSKPFSFDKLDLSNTTKRFLDWSTRGLFIVTGPTGSAKTTTLSAIIDYFNNEAQINQGPRNTHIITIEQPIEYVHERNQAIISSKNVPTDCPTFAKGLRDALRERPDIIMIGEVRDSETAETMLHAAESGHLVFATMHTNSAVSVITKLLSFFPENEHAMILNTLSNSLLGVVSQVMVPTLKQDGFKVVSEHFLNSPNIDKRIGELIAKGDTAGLQSLIAKSNERGSDARGGEAASYLQDKLLHLARNGEIAKTDAVRASYNPIEMMTALKPGTSK